MCIMQNKTLWALKENTCGAETTATVTHLTTAQSRGERCFTEDSSFQRREVISEVTSVQKSLFHCLFLSLTFKKVAFSFPSVRVDCNPQSSVGFIAVLKFCVRTCERAELYQLILVTFVHIRKMADDVWSLCLYSISQWHLRLVLFH